MHFANTVFVESFANSLKKKEVVIEQADINITHRASNEEDVLKCSVTILNLEKGDVANKPKQKETLILKIIDVIESKLPVFDKRLKSYRPIEYGDISILCRYNGACSEFASYLSINISKADTFNALDPLANREIRLTIKGFNGSTNIEAYDNLINPSPTKIQAQQFAIEEEKRLFYVGATRAKDYLYICTAQNKFTVPEIINPRLNVSKLSNGIHDDVFGWMNEPVTVQKESMPIMKDNSLESYNKGLDRLYFKEVSGRIDRDVLKMTPSTLPPIEGAFISNIVDIHDRIVFLRNLNSKSHPCFVDLNYLTDFDTQKSSFVENK